MIADEEGEESLKRTVSTAPTSVLGLIMIVSDP